jgi:hypothetical protein
MLSNNSYKTIEAGNKLCILSAIKGQYKVPGLSKFVKKTYIGKD